MHLSTRFVHRVGALALLALMLARPAAAQSTVQVVVDVPAPNAMAAVPFVIAGWALDTAAPSGTGIDFVHVWAFPATGGGGVFLGSATLGVSRPDVGAYLGAQFNSAGFGLQVAEALPAGLYTVQVFARQLSSGTWAPALVIPLVLTKTTLSDLTCAPQQGPQWNGSSWTCATSPGPAGVAGVAGPMGPIGSAGPTGLTGPAGPTGPTGPTGPVGPIGPTGFTGPAGQIGPMGLAGPIGPTGATGVADLTGVASSKDMTLSAPGFVSLLSIALAAGDAAGGRISYTIVATDGGSQIATETGVIKFNATANSITCTSSTEDKLHLGTVNSGCTPGFFNPGSQPGVSIFDNVTFSSPAPIVVHKVYFRIENLSNSLFRIEP
jgi:hypothetical protein